MRDMINLQKAKKPAPRRGKRARDTRLTKRERAQGQETLVSLFVSPSPARDSLKKNNGDLQRR
jgi:hypothetical protein